MREVGVRALKQNASAVVAEAAAGTPVTVTDRGRPVAQLVPLAGGALRSMIAAGQARPARRSFATLPEPQRRRRGATTLSEALAEERDSEPW